MVVTKRELYESKHTTSAGWLQGIQMNAAVVLCLLKVHVSIFTALVLSLDFGLCLLSDYYTFI